MPENSFTRKASLIAWISAATLVLTSCAELPIAAPITPVDYRGCVLSQSDTDDRTLTELSEYSMNQAAVTYGIQRTDLSIESTKLASGVKKMVKAGCDLIVVSGIAFKNGLTDLASKNRATNFVYVSEKAESEISSANLDNLISYGVDLYEVGVIAGFLAADLSAKHYVSMACSSGISETILSGAKYGSFRFDTETGTATRVVARTGAMITPESDLPDVEIIAGCQAAAVPNDAVSAYVGYGRDHYLLPRYSAIKEKLAATVVPQIGAKLLEVVASDLENDFIGGSFGSVTATYGNGLLALSAEHEIPLSANTLTKLQTVIADYEAGLK